MGTAILKEDERILIKVNKLKKEFESKGVLDDRVDILFGAIISCIGYPEHNMKKQAKTKS